jgi:23S rRNA pseudouridine1911/1915/1917 synthase
MDLPLKREMKDYSPEIIYSDSDIVVCVKPAGVLAEDSPGGIGVSLPSLLKESLGAEEIYCVHRLDAGTRGLMVFARSRKAAASLSKAIQDGLFVKEYEALVHGVPESEEGGRELCDYLLKDSAKNKVYVVKSLRKGVREARLVYTVKEIRGETALVRVRLITGRTHQIRVQFASRGFPLVGDRKYGAKDDAKNIALCAAAVTFPHPLTGEQMRFEIASEL